MQTRRVSTAPTVVGYQNKAVAKFSPITSTFTPVQGEEVWTYDDYKVNCDETKVTSTSGWLANNDSLNTYTAVGLFDKAYVYVSQALADALKVAYPSIVRGWYAKDDKKYEHCMNDKQIDFGLGFIAKATFADAAVTFSGAVKSAPTVSDIGKFTVAGNASAVDRWIGELIVNCDETKVSSTSGWLANNDTINVYTSVGLFDKAYVYIPQALADALKVAYPTIVKGWYAKDDKKYENCVSTTRKFVAGEGFVAKATFTDATLTIKSALATDAE